MTDRVLTMLYQFLLSNQALELNETFQIYLKVLSIDHSTFNATLKPRKQYKKRPRLHVGNSDRHYNFKWAIDIPSSNNFFVNKCLLLCTILGLTQHSFFENKKEKNFFQSISRLSSSVKRHQTYATNLMIKQLEKLFTVTGLKQTGPYELKSTITMLSQSYKCQFFVFDSMNNCPKMFYMYPKVYDDSLKPIFLYKPSLDPNHVLFIRDLKVYFLRNCFICLACHREFNHIRRARSSHLCKKRETCFACRRFFQSNDTYLNCYLEEHFCDKLTTSESSFKCPLCNCHIFSKKCYAGHKRFCRGQGYFGYKCDECNKFTYCKGNNSVQLSNNHKCTDLKMCKICFKMKEPNHLCQMKFEKSATYHTRLAFFKIAFDKISNEPLFALFYREENLRGDFSKYIFFDPNLNSSNIIENNQLSSPYFDSQLPIPNQDFPRMSKIKLKDNFISSLKSLEESEETFSKQLAMFLLDQNFTNTTYLCEDSSSINLVC